MDPNEFFNMEREFVKNKTQDWNITGWNGTYHVTNSFSFSHFLNCTFLTQIKKKVKRFLCCGTQNQIDRAHLL